MGNLLCGFLSIMASHNGNLARAAWLIILAAFMDALDGRVARLSKSTSKFGQELDSLADIVSFGVAPAFLTLIAVLNDFDAYMGWIVAVFFMMTGAFPFGALQRHLRPAPQSAVSWTANTDRGGYDCVVYHSLHEVLPGNSIPGVLCDHGHCSVRADGFNGGL